MRWKTPTIFDKNSIENLTSSLGISEVLAQLLVLRGVNSFEEAKDFFRPEFKHLHDPFLMKGMKTAVDRLIKALHNKEKIMIYGDYDVDGTTAVSVVYDYLSKNYTNIGFYIPDRYEEGYGVSYKGVDFAADNGYTLLITLDCGIKEIDKIKHANTRGVDVIVCDHHKPGDILPPALAILNPKQKDCPYPFKELTGCGVGYKLLCALAQTEDKTGKSLEKAHEYLDLVAISSCCDIVPLNGENRVIVFLGLKKMKEKHHQGIGALLNMAQFAKSELTVTDLVFVLGPRINAAGRIEHGKKVVELLTTPNEDLANQIASEIDKNNTDRKDLDKQITAEALGIMEQETFYQHAKSTVLYKEDWHKGVIGIVASRLIEKHYKPTIVLTYSNGKAAGSARSIKDFDVYEAIEKCSDLLEQFGGHKYAAGLTMKPENVLLFRDKFEQVVSASVTDEMLIPEIEVDVEIDFKDITPKFTRILKQFAPFGPANMNPVFCTKKVTDYGYTNFVGTEGKHIKFYVKQEDNSKMKGIGFNLGEHLEKIKSKEPFSIVYTLEENHWNGKTTWEMNVKDLKFE